jgi:hypothetical protein
MNQFDKQRIENALWTLEQYSNEFFEVMQGIYIDNTYISPNDILFALHEAKNRMEFKEE